MSPTTAKFNVQGIVFEVAVTAIQSQPESRLAKMIDGRLRCLKDEIGAFFIDRSPEFFNIVIDVYRDNRVYPSKPGMTHDRILAELKYYGLEDFEAVPTELVDEDATTDTCKGLTANEKTPAKDMLSLGNLSQLLIARAASN
jgi:hypothetical protein